MFQNQQRARVSTDSAARVVTSKGYRVQTVRGNILNKNLLQFHIKIFYKKKNNSIIWFRSHTTSALGGEILK